MRLIHTLQKPIPIDSLVVFRILLGGILLLIIGRTLFYGWVSKFYVRPCFFFHFDGFSWVQPLGEMAMYAVFIGLFICALCILIGFYYKIAVLLFFVGFTYTELLDVTHYLNHYYLVSLLCFLMIFMPAHRACSLDVWRKPHLRVATVPKWTVLALQLQIALVYFYAGVAKVQSEWLLDAQPLRIWLARHSDIPFVGSVFSQVWLAFVMSWAGMLYDLTIAFWLFWAKTRWAAYAAVIVFHTFTWLLFPIGVFPFLMIGVTIIFFSADAHTRLLKCFMYPLIWILSKFNSKFAATSNWAPTTFAQRILAVVGIAYFSVQLLAPLRHYCYKGDVLWTEAGFRFSWKVMLVEKRGTATFRVQDAASTQESEVNNLDYLTEKQEFMMCTQPDLILQFARFLGEEYRQEGYTQPQVYADVFVAFNGRPSRRLVNPKIDLMQENIDFLEYDF